MATPVKRQVKVLQANYVEEAQSILIVGECQEGRFRTQIHRDALASYGDRTEEEIVTEVKKTADMMIGKTLYIVFDPDLEERLDANAPLNYD